jgi:DNA-binding transcriptional MerR regulator
LDLDHLPRHVQKRLDLGTDSRAYNQNVVQKPYLRSGELASLTGISPDTLRHYERLKLLALPRRSSGNYRLYPPEAVDRVRLIRRALAIGFSLRELAKILKVRDEGGSPCRQVKLLLEEKLFKMDEQIGDLVAMRDHLRTVLADWDKQLARTFKGSPARLLDTLIVPEHRANPVRLERKAI